LTLPLLTLWPDAAAFWLAYSGALALEAVLHSRRATPRGRESDRHSLLLIATAAPLALAAAFGAALLWPQPHTFAGDRALLWLGIALTGVGAFLRYLSIRALGTAFTPRVTTFVDQPLVARGVYQWIRHPSYTGAMLILVGAGAAMGAWASMAVMLIVVAPAYGYRIHVEERAMLAAFGEPYQRYMRNTRRLLPGIL
jgi:protein-S-isoprenylcysteine O-methyltransferase Ste14